LYKTISTSLSFRRMRFYGYILKIRLVAPQAVIIVYNVTPASVLAPSPILNSIRHRHLRPIVRGSQ